MTKKLKVKAAILGVLRVLLNIGPLVFYTILSLIQSDGIGTKITLGCTVTLVLIFSAVAWLNKIALRSRLWILLIGFWLCLDTFLPALIVIATCQVLDELVFTPLHKHYKNRVVINKEIDRRQ